MSNAQQSRATRVQQAHIMRVLSRCGSWHTTDDVARHCYWSRLTVWRRLRELEQAGRVSCRRVGECRWRVAQ
jgi:response regulator of citrate/malate metabolism